MAKTKRDYFNEIKELVNGNDEYVAFLDREIEKLDERAEKTKANRAMKAAEAGATVAAAVKAALEDAGRPLTLPELAGAIDGYTPAKIVYHIRPLVEDGTVVKEKVKVDDRKVMTYRLG